MQPRTMQVGLLMVWQYSEWTLVVSFERTRLHRFDHIELSFLSDYDLQKYDSFSNYITSGIVDIT